MRHRVRRAVDDVYAALPRTRELDPDSIMYIKHSADAMAMAIDLAQQGEREGHRPFGCVIYERSGYVLSTAYGTESENDPTRHSEILAIREACAKVGLLYGCTLVSTHEPCVMCAGAITHAKVAKLAYGSRRVDLPELFRPKPIQTILKDTGHPPRVWVGLMHRRCVALFDREVAAVRNKSINEEVLNG